MAKEPEACAYCAKTELCEIEHVLPESWYPDGYPRSEMVTVPACTPCNRDYGRLEERLFLPFTAGLPVDSDPRVVGIVARALRAVDPTVARSERDGKHRAGRRVRLQSRMAIIEPDDGSIPMWVPKQPGPVEAVTPQGEAKSGVGAISIDPDDVERLGIKLTKGMYRAARGVPLPADVEVDARAFSANPEPVLRQARDAGYNVWGKFPFRGLFTYAAENPVVSLWYFILWDHLVISGATGARFGEVAARRAAARERDAREHGGG